MKFFLLSLSVSLSLSLFTNNICHNICEQKRYMRQKRNVFKQTLYSKTHFFSPKLLTRLSFLVYERHIIAHLKMTGHM